MRVYLCTWPHGAGGDPRDIERVMKVYLVAKGNDAGTPNSPHADGMGLDKMKIYLAESMGAGGRDLAAAGKQAQAGKEPTKTYLAAGQQSANSGEIPAIGKASGGLRLRLLLSYFYFRDFDFDDMVSNLFKGATEVDIFVDSGAFSAATGGTTIDTHQYIEWVRKWQHRITVASAPDVIGDAVATERETDLMLKAGLTCPVLPVYHVGEPWDVLERMARQHPYIALGGMVPFAKRGQFLKIWCAKAFSMIPRTTKVHGFGMTNWTTMQQFPWYSVDSSSWTSGVRYGQFQLFDRGRMVDVTMTDRKRLLQQSALLRRYGLTARATVSRGQSFDRDAIIRANLLSWHAAEDWMNSR